MSWADDIPEGHEERKPRKKFRPILSLFKYLLIGILAFVAIMFFSVFANSNIWALFGPIFLVLGAAFFGLVILGIVVRIIWWALTAPFKRGR